MSNDFAQHTSASCLSPLRYLSKCIKNIGESRSILCKLLSIRPVAALAAQLSKDEYVASIGTAGSDPRDFVAFPELGVLNIMLSVNDLHSSVVADGDYSSFCWGLSVLCPWNLESWEPGVYTAASRPPSKQKSLKILKTRVLRKT